MHVMNDENDYPVIELAPHEFEALSRALAAPPAPSPALAQALGELQERVVNPTSVLRPARLP